MRPNVKKLMDDQYVNWFMENFLSLETIPLVKRDDLEPEIALAEYKKNPNLEKFQSKSTVDQTDSFAQRAETDSFKVEDLPVAQFDDVYNDNNDTFDFDQFDESIK